jgi:hypothetical protein
VLATIPGLGSSSVVLAPFPQIFFNSLCKSGFGGANYLPSATFDT